MKVIYQFSKKGAGKANEDILGVVKNYAWVLDGATDVFNNNTFNVEDEVSWYMNLLQQTIAEYCSKTNNKDLCQVLSESVISLYDRLSLQYNITNVPSYVTPTFAAAMIGAFENDLYYYILGDCTVAYNHNGMINIIDDKRIKQHSKNNRILIKEYMAENQFAITPIELFRSTRSKANSKGGYPIGTISGEGLTHGITGKVPLNDGDRVLVFSDGILDYVKAKPDSIPKLFHDNISEEINHLYAFLNDERAFFESPRPKKIDDVSIVLVEV